MSHRKLVIAVMVALVMVFVNVPVGMAGGPGTNSWSDVQTDGGEGHPWDDGTGGTDTTPPGDEQGAEPEQSIGSTPEPFVTTASVSVFPSWNSSAVFHLWTIIKAEVHRTRVVKYSKTARLFK